MLNIFNKLNKYNIVLFIIILLFNAIGFITGWWPSTSEVAGGETVAITIQQILEKFRGLDLLLGFGGNAIYAGADVIGGIAAYLSYTVEPTKWRGGVKGLKKAALWTGIAALVLLIFSLNILSFGDNLPIPVDYINAWYVVTGSAFFFGFVLLSVNVGWTRAINRDGG